MVSPLPLLTASPSLIPFPRAPLPLPLTPPWPINNAKALGGRQPHEVFDMIVGTSTGGIIAGLAGVKAFPVSKCEMMYDSLINKIFIKHPGGGMKLALTQVCRTSRPFPAAINAANYALVLRISGGGFYPCFALFSLFFLPFWVHRFFFASVCFTRLCFK